MHSYIRRASSFFFLPPKLMIDLINSKYDITLCIYVHSALYSSIEYDILSPSAFSIITLSAVTEYFVFTV